MKHALIIDGHHFLYKAYAVPFSFSTEKGTPLHVVTTFLSLTRRAYELSNKPDSITVIFDSPEENSNKELYKDYKANRNYEYEEDDNPFMHIPIIKAALSSINIPWHEIPGYEADDIIATHARQLLDNNANKVTIVSSDSDFYQLLSNEKIDILRLVNSNRHHVYNKRWFEKEFGFHPKKYVEYKSYLGDTADNIKGIAGIGKVRAGKIIRKEMDFSPTKKQEKILDRNRTLIKLDGKVNINIATKNLDEQSMEIPNKEIFKRCGF